MSGWDRDINKKFSIGGFVQKKNIKPIKYLDN